MDVVDERRRSRACSATPLTDSAADATPRCSSSARARDVYHDYIGIAGTPAKSDATAAEFATPLWNSWAQSYTSVSQASVLAWAKGLHAAGIPGAHDPDRRRLVDALRRLRLQQQVPGPEGAVRPDPRHGLQLRALGHALDQQRRGQLRVRRVARLSAEVEGRPEQAVQRHLVERHSRHRRPRQSGRAGSGTSGNSQGLREDLQRQRVQVRHPVLRRVAARRTRATPRSTTSSSARS